MTFYKTIKIRSNKCNNKVHFKEERTSLKERDSLIIKHTIQVIFRILQTDRVVTEVEIPLHHHLRMVMTKIKIPQIVLETEPQVILRNRRIKISIMYKNLINHLMKTLPKKQYQAEERKEAS